METPLHSLRPHEWHNAPFRASNSAYDDPFTTPYPAKKPVSPASAPATWPHVIGIRRWEQAHETMCSEDAVERARLALETLRMKRLEHEAAYEELRCKYRATRRVRDARWHAHEMAVRMADEVLLSRSVVFWMFSSLNCALRQWKRVYRTWHIANASLMSLCNRHLRLAVNSWKEITEFHSDRMRKMRSAIIAVCFRQLRASLNSWKEAAELKILMQRRLRIAVSEWRGESLRACWRSWRSVADRVRQLWVCASAFRPDTRQRRQAFNSWWKATQKETARQRILPRRWQQIANTSKPRGRNYRKELMEHFRQEYGNGPSGMPMIRFG